MFIMAVAYLKCPPLVGDFFNFKVINMNRKDLFNQSSEGLNNCTPNPRTVREWEKVANAQTPESFWMPKCGLQAAYWAMLLGFNVFPCNPKTKKPLITGWPQAACKDELTVQNWWEQFPTAMVGAVTGRSSGMIVIDIDPEEGQNPFDMWEDLEKKFGEVIPNFVVATPSGGLHLYCEMPKDTDIPNTTGKLGKGIDTRGTGGYIIFAGSTRYDGKKYRLVEAEVQHEQVI